MKKLLLVLLLLVVPTIGQEIDGVSISEIKSKPIRTLDIKDIRAQHKEYVTSNPKAFWWDFAIMNQISMDILLGTGPDDGNIVTPWQTTILAFKLGKTPALYFYGQLRFSAILGGVINSSVGPTTKFNYGGLIGMGGKIGEVRLKNSGKEFLIASTYVSGGFLLESKRYEQSAELPYFGFEVDFYTVFEAPLLSAIVGYSLGMDVRNRFSIGEFSGQMINSPFMPFKVGFLLGIMF